MGCACGSRANIEEHINDFINDMVITKSSINEYKKNLELSIQNEKFYNGLQFENVFLNPLFECKSSNFKEIQKSVLEYFYQIKDDNLVYFLPALSFLCDTLNFSSLKSNYEMIVYEILPENLTKVIKTKNALRVFKKIVKFYVKLVSQFIVGAIESVYSKNIEDKNALDDLKIIYGNVYINEFIRKLFLYENENDFNLEKFLKISYEKLKHTAIREKLLEIFTTSPKLHYENDDDDTDIFSFEESVKEEELKEIDITNNFEKLDFEIEHTQEVSEHKEKSILKEIKQEETKQDETKQPQVLVQAKREINYNDLATKKAGIKITAVAKAFLYKKVFNSRIKQDLEKQQNKINEYIVKNFPSEKVNKAENNRKKVFEIDGWSKFYPENTKIFNINHGEVHETKFLIFNGNEYYSGLLNREGQKHGFGVSIKRQGEKYQGFFFENLYHGWGELIDKNGNIFQGLFKHGILSGKGEKFSLDGNYYIGDFENFQKHGLGKEDTELYNYNGEFKKNKKNGKGKIYMKVLKDSYQGDFLDDSITGKGEYQWSNNNNYVGEFLNGKMHGKGINKWPDGTIYEGEYKNGIKDGYGKYTKPNGKIYEGTLKNGKPHGKGVLISDKGKFDVEFDKGILISNTDNKKEQIKPTDNNNLLSLKNKEYKPKEESKIFDTENLQSDVESENEKKGERHMKKGVLKVEDEKNFKDETKKGEPKNNEYELNKINKKINEQKISSEKILPKNISEKETKNELIDEELNNKKIEEEQNKNQTLKDISKDEKNTDINPLNNVEKEKIAKGHAEINEEKNEISNSKNILKEIELKGKENENLTNKKEIEQE